jgi:cell division protein FtsL
VNHPVYRYRYAIVFGIFLLWMSFFDVNNFVYRYRLGAEIRDLEDNIRRHEKEIEALKRQRNELFSSPSNLEKFARERYLMKRDGEDVFVVEEAPAP